MDRSRSASLGVFAAVVALAASLLAPAVASATVVPMDLPALTQGADAIVVVRVSGQSARAVGPMAWAHRRIFTDSRLRVERVLKGSRPAEVVLSQLGGSLGGERLEVSELPRIARGERCILFLNAGGGVVGGYQGKLAIVGDRVPELGLTLAETIASIRDGGRTPLAGSAPAPAPNAAQPGGEAASIDAAGLAPDAEAALVGGGPQITSITPPGANAGIGDRVLIAGAGFGATAGSVRFKDGRGHADDDATILSWSDTSIVCVVPPNAESGDATVTRPDGSTMSRSYSVGFSTSGMKWKSLSVSYRVNENCPNASGEAAAAQRAFATWNACGSSFRYSYAGSCSTAGQPTGADGYNDICWADGFPDKGIAAWNMRWFYSSTPSTIEESDIVINNNTDYPWFDGAKPWTLDIESVILHELGHTLSLDDQYDDSKVMGSLMVGVPRKTLTQSEIDGARYLFDAPKTPTVSSSTHPTQTSWYGGSATLDFSATGPTAVDGYSYVLDTSPVTVPDTGSEGVATTYSTSGLADGEHWFHVRARTSSGVWGPAAHYRLGVDTLAPSGSVTIGDPLAEFANSVHLPVSASLSDSVSGLADMRAAVGSTWGSWTPYAASSSVTLPSADGTYTVQVECRDKAGNVASFSRAIALDVTAPTSAATFAAGWHRDPVDVSLAATDSMSGVASTTYRVGGGAAASYGGPFQVAGDGQIPVQFSSTDVAGNLEQTKTVNVLIDSTPPVTTSEAVAAYPATATFALAPHDAGCGVAKTSFSVDDGAWSDGTTVTVSGEGTHTVAFASVDLLGNAEPTQTVTLHVGDGTVAFPAVWSGAVVRDSGAAQVVSAYLGAVEITATVRDFSGMPIPDPQASLQRSTDGRSFADVSGAVGVGGGSFRATVRVASKTWYRFRYVASGLNAEAFSSAVSITPRVYVSTPSAKSTVRANRTFSVNGVLKPARRAGGKSVLITVSRLVNHKWVKYRTVWATNMKAAGYTRYVASLRLPRGSYSIRATAAADAFHASGASGTRKVAAR